MPEKANQSGGISWSHTAVRSQTVEEYKADHGGKRPKFEVSTKGKHLRILTGANVTRKRDLTLRGMALGFWGGLKIAYQTIKIDPAGKERRRRNAVLTAGQKFDGGINKLVEDMVKGKDLSDKSWGLRGRMKFDERVEALYKQAKVLKAKGEFSDEDIAERFRINLMESLRVVQKESKPEDYKKVLRQITKDILPAFKELAGPPPAKDKLRKNKEMFSRLSPAELKEFHEKRTFKRSAVFVALLDVETFGCDKKKFDAFDGSHVLHDIYNGNLDLLKDSDGDVLGASEFNGDADAYGKWGACAPLYKRFGGNPAELQGTGGAAALRHWLDRTYGQGSGDTFFKHHPQFKNGANNENHRQALGAFILTGFEKYKGLGINQWDLNPANAIKKRDSELMRGFENYLKNAKRRREVDKGPSLKWLCDLEELQRDAQNKNFDAKTLRTKIKALVNKTMSSKSQVFVTKGGHEKFRKTFEMLAHSKILYEERSTKEILKDLDDLNKTQLLQVLNEGFSKAKSDLCEIIKTPLKQFGDITVARNQKRRHNIVLGHGLQDAYWGLDTGGIGYDAVQQYLKPTDVTVEQVELDGDDLRMIEKKLYDGGHDRHPPESGGRDSIPVGGDAWIQGPEYYFGEFDKFGLDQKIDIDTNEKNDIDPNEIIEVDPNEITDISTDKKI